MIINKYTVISGFKKGYTALSLSLSLAHALVASISHARIGSHRSLSLSLVGLRVVVHEIPKKDMTMWGARSMTPWANFSCTYRVDQPVNTYEGRLH
jgi:hypothetical protein